MQDLNSEGIRYGAKSRLATTAILKLENRLHFDFKVIMNEKISQTYQNMLTPRLKAEKKSSKHNVSSQNIDLLTTPAGSGSSATDLFGGLTVFLRGDRELSKS